MKCNCGFTGEKYDFGTLEAAYPSGLISREPARKGRRNRGGETVYFRPECGALKNRIC
jgi:hypothetical protein